MLRWIERILAGFGLFVILLILAVVINFVAVPSSNCKLTHFDTLMVLGCPALLNGQVSPEGRERALEGVKEFKAGRASHIIFTGGPTENHFVEGQVMATYAETQGVPPSAIFVDGESHNTVQNIYFGNQIMQQHGWTSAEIISSPSHLPRVGLILQRFHFQWRTKACSWPSEYDWRDLGQVYLSESIETMILRWYGFKASIYLPLRHDSR